jgi:hypothetical protein
MTAVLDLPQTSPPISGRANEGDSGLTIGLFSVAAFGTSAGFHYWRRARLVVSPLTSLSSTSTDRPVLWIADFGSTRLPRSEPIWAAAARAFAEGRLKPLPRMPTVRPESDYEMDPAEAAAFVESEYQSRRRGYR